MPGGKQPAQVLLAEAVLICIVLQEVGGSLLPTPLHMTYCMPHSSLLAGHHNATVPFTLACTIRAPGPEEEVLRLQHLKGPLLHCASVPPGWAETAQLRL